jgi:parallel beta-helix repeat protein
LEFGVNTTLTFWYRDESSTHPQDLEVYVNDTLVWSDYGFTHDHYIMETVHLDSFSGLKKITFLDPGPSDFYGKMVDLITVTTSSIVYVDDDFNSSTPGWQSTHFDVIQDGIDAVTERGTVYVYNGTYYENLLINKTINLIGEDTNTTIIDGNRTGHVITIDTENVNISGFFIMNATNTFDYGGIYVRKSNTHIFNNKVTSCYNAIKIRAADLNTINNNFVYGNSNGIHLYYSSDYNTIINNTIIINTLSGIRLDDSAYNTFSYNEIANNHYDGIVFFQQTLGNSIYNNSIHHNNDCGLQVGSSDNIIKNNSIISNFRGITLTYAHRNEITNNMIKNNNWDNIQLDQSNNNIIDNNTIDENVKGAACITILESDNSLITNNCLINCSTGIRCLALSINNQIYHIIFYINSEPGYDNSNNYWDNGYPSGGNYWSKYSGVDNDGDGIGDTPYNIVGGSNKDNYPFIHPYGWLIELDINQSIHDRGFPIRHATDGDWAGAQNFTPTQNNLAFSKIYLRKFGTPEFNLTVELREDAIDGPILDTLVFEPSEVPSTWTWLELDFADITVTPGVDYFIKCPPAPSGVTTSFGYEWGYAFGNQYDDGAFWFTRDSGNLWRDLPTMYEFVFRTYGYD